MWLLCQAAVKYGNLERQLEQQQQDMVRLKLKHQLQLKVSTLHVYPQYIHVPELTAVEASRVKKLLA